MGNLIDLTGHKYNKLTVISRDTSVISGKPRWVCQCDCGKTKSVLGSSLRNGSVKSCGCLLTELGLSRRQYEKPLEQFPEYHSWRSMRRRCYDENATGYSNYGGRGIRVDKRWLNSFDNFYNDMGPRPSPEHSLDRENNDRNYEPGNCRWATPEEQSNNKRNCTYYEIDGERLTLPAIARRHGLNYSRLYWYISRGYDLTQAIDIVKDKSAVS